MLTASQYDPLLQPIIDLYDEFQTSVIKDIARRLGNMSIDSAAWQVQRLSESGAVYENILEEISKLTGQSEKVLRDTFEKAGVKAMRFDDSIYRKAGLEPLPLNLSPAMAEVLAADIAVRGFGAGFPALLGLLSRRMLHTGNLHNYVFWFAAGALLYGLVLLVDWANLFCCGQ